MRAVLLHIKLVKSNQYRTMISPLTCHNVIQTSYRLLGLVYLAMQRLSTLEFVLHTRSHQFSLVTSVKFIPRQLFKGHSWSVWRGESLRYDICSTDCCCCIIVHCVHMNKSQATDTTCTLSIASLRVWPSFQRDGEIIIYHQKLLSITGNVLNLL